MDKITSTETARQLIKRLGKVSVPFLMRKFRMNHNEAVKLNGETINEGNKDRWKNSSGNDFS